MRNSTTGTVATAMVAWLVALGAPRAAEQAGQISGTVLDASGAPVAGAMVEVDVGGVQAGEVESGNDGRFAVSNVSAGQAVVIARAEGFADAIMQITAPADGLQLVLYPAPLFATVTVTASLGAADLDTPASVSVLTSADLALSAAGTIDDKLRNTPGFSLFRRQSSRVANPTTQGVTLRGVSGSGASRTQVLADGMSLNDPFGNWVYWNRIPEAAIERVEVMRGAAGDLYGESALGGVIQLLTFDPERPSARATFDGGSHDTVRLSAFVGGQNNGWSYQGSGEFNDTKGVVIVAEDARGAADVEAFSDYATGFAGAGYTTPAWRGRFRAGLYDEDRGNGTPEQVNNTKWQNVAGELSGTTGTGAWNLDVGGGTQEFYQTFTAVIRSRSEERIVRSQLTNTNFFNVSGQWVQSLGAHTLVVGGDGSRADGVLDNTRHAFGTGLPIEFGQLGGTETKGSGFAQVGLRVSGRTTIRLGARGEFWRSDPLRAEDPEHSASFFSPRGAVAFLVREDVQLQLSGYRSYRAPTLNELYRGFQVGSIVTNANAQLEPERLTGVEGGVVLTRGNVSARVTGFFNHLDDAIANVTLRTDPAIVRQRQNAGRIRAAGVEVEAEFRPHPAISIGALAVFTDSTFRGSARLPALEGNSVPQVPDWQVGGSFTYSDPRYLTASVQMRGVGEQFDDDLNDLILGSFGVVDAYVNRAVSRGINVFFAAENLFDQEYDVRTNPRTTGWPQTFRGGVRVTLP